MKTKEKRMKKAGENNNKKWMKTLFFKMKNRQKKIEKRMIKSKKERKNEFKKNLKRMKTIFKK